MAAPSAPVTTCHGPRVAVVGSGAAGLMAALSAADSAQVTLITDRALGKSNTALAQGGLQFPQDTADSLRSFQEDMRKSARVPLDPELTARFAAEARDTILYLAALGLAFDQDEHGEWLRKSAGGLSEPRIVSVGDRIGLSLLKVLLQAVRARAIQILEGTRVTGVQAAGGGWELTLQGSGAGADQRCFDAVVLATGGASFSRAAALAEPTTNPRNDNACMHEILRGLGLEEVHADFFQYQPFGIVTDTDYSPPGKAFPESILTYPVRIIDNLGNVLMAANEKPDRLTLCQRLFDAEKAGRAFTTAGGRRGFQLLLNELPAELLETHFPSAMAYLRKHGHTGGPVLIHPFLHYQLGGFRIGTDCQSTLPGLFLAGELAGGLHGQNRLMGNGLTDSLVHGRRAGFSAARHASANHPQTQPAS